MEDKKNFEETMQQLDAIVKRLESGEGTLDEMVARYEEGMKLYQTCSEMLSAYEKRLDVLREETPEA